MPNANELLIPPETPETPEALKLVRATVLDVNGRLRVHVPSLNRGVDVEHWVGDPQPGDELLLGIDEDGNEWVIGGVEATGIPGADGATWRTGSGVPSNGLGADGDLYLRTSNGDVYQRSGGTYSVVANITGPAGATGSPGSTGAAGPTGSVAASTGTSFPGSPADGDIFAYNVDTTNGVKWLFQYRAAGASGKKWECIGGPPILVEVTTSTSRSSASYGNPASGSGPDVAVPFAGDYIVGHGFGSAMAAGKTGYMSYDIGASAAVDADAVQYETSTGNQHSSVSRHQKKTFAGALTLASKYKGSDATAQAIKDRWISLAPIRVSG